MAVARSRHACFAENACYQVLSFRFDVDVVPLTSAVDNPEPVTIARTPADKEPDRSNTRRLAVVQVTQLKGR